MVWNRLPNAYCGSRSWARQFICENVHMPVKMAWCVSRRRIAFAILLLIPFGTLAYLQRQKVRVPPTTLPESNDEKAQDTQNESNLTENYDTDQINTKPPQAVASQASSRNKFELAIKEHPELPHIKHFDFTINNQSMCALNGEKGVYFLILVCSAPKNFPTRQSIRNTWGSVKHLENWAIRLVFMLGSVESNPELQSSVYNESLEHGDMILSSNFEDTYRNLTLKHLMGYQWTTEYCPDAKFVVRIDDDMFIDIFQLYTFVSSHYRDPVNLILCDPSIGTEPIRDPEGYAYLWFVTREEFTLDEYPAYCNGMGYLITLDVLSTLLATSMRIPLFWIDDVYVTGILREVAGHEISHLDLGYTWNQTEYLNWLDDPVSGKRPITFVVDGRQAREMEQLWNKTRIAWSKKIIG